MTGMAFWCSFGELLGGEVAFVPEPRADEFGRAGRVFDPLALVVTVAPTWMAADGLIDQPTRCYVRVR